MSSNLYSGNRRIAKNTIILYFRTFLVMLVSLYTSRVILNTLGETDFGIYNVVGGVVVLFSFFNSAMSTATQRFLNYALGHDDLEETKRIFSMSMTVHILIALIVIILSETIGLWFVNTQLHIPENRLVAAKWVYQFSVFGCCLQIIRIPYNASIIAYERMSFYAYISIVEVTLKLLICYLLVVSHFDRLITYSIMMFIVLFVVNLIYQIYCKREFRTAAYNFFWDKPLFVELMSFSGWSLMGSTANVGANQGVNILFNIFVGVVANAALGIAHQVQSAVSSFVSSFQTAFIPQLVKSYAAGEEDYFYSLMFRASRFSFFLVWIIGFPIILCCDTILGLWLNDVPQYTSSFAVLYIAFCMIDACSSPLWNAIQATGNIKKYQIVLSLIIMANIPIAYIILEIGLSPIIVVLVRVILNVVAHVYRIIYLRKHIKLNVRSYLIQVMMPIFLIIILSIPIPLLMTCLMKGLIGQIIVFVVSVIICLSLVLLVGLTRTERSIIVSQIKSKLQ